MSYHTLAIFDGVSGDSIKDFLLIVASFGAIIIGFKKLTEKKEKLDQPFQVVGVKDLATREELIRVENELEAKLALSEAHRVAEMKGLRDEVAGIAHSFREAVGRTHARIDALSERSSELKGSVDMMNKNIERLMQIGMKQRP